MIVLYSAGQRQEHHEAGSHEAGFSAGMPTAHIESRLVLQIENLRHIECAYGAEVAREALQGAGGALAGLSGADAASYDGGGPLALGFVELPALPKRRVPHLGSTPSGTGPEAAPAVVVRTSAGPLCLWISRGGINPGKSAPSAFGESAGSSQFHFSPISTSSNSEWGACYRRDMALVVKTLLAMHSFDASENFSGAEHALLRWQPICAARDPAMRLYHEAVASLVGGDGRLRPALAEMAAFERLGMARLFDVHFVTMAVEELATCPEAILGVRISAQSVAVDPWWSELVRWLNCHPDIAGRLVIEISETALISDISEAVRFVALLRRTGCQIALDNFGVGYSSIRQVLALSPDIIKVDGFFLRRASQSVLDKAMLGHLVALAGATGAVVVVKGVGSGEEASLALSAAAQWQQGDFWGGPVLTRPWRALCSSDVPPPSGAACAGRDGSSVGALHHDASAGRVARDNAN